MDNEEFNEMEVIETPGVNSEVGEITMAVEPSQSFIDAENKLENVEEKEENAKDRRRISVRDPLYREMVAEAKKLGITSTKLAEKALEVWIETLNK